jgi:hypothetical protein
LKKNFYIWGIEINKPLKFKIMYKVIRTTTWNKKGVDTNFFSYLSANNINEATKLAAKRWGLDNIKEIIEE